MRSSKSNVKLLECGGIINISLVKNNIYLSINLIIFFKVHLLKVINYCVLKPH